MAIDITTMDGYREDMTVEERLELALNYEAPAPDYSGYIKKDSFDKTASELAEAKRQLKAKMTEDEQKEAERIAAEAAIKAELEALRKENSITKSKAEFLALGYDDKLAGEAATALANGDLAQFNLAQKAFIENVKKAERAAVLANDPKPPAGGSGGAKITKEQFAAMGYSERLKLFNEQPETYKKFTEG